MLVWSNNVHRFPDDYALRQMGFRIWSRPKSGDVLWMRDGKQYTQKQALRMAKREKERSA
jgi:hypothetical protein